MADLEKIDGMRLEWLKGAVLLATCACGYEGEIPVSNLVLYFPEDTRIKALMPRLFCTACKARDIQRIRVKRS